MSLILALPCAGGAVVLAGDSRVCSGNDSFDASPKVRVTGAFGFGLTGMTAIVTRAGCQDALDDVEGFWADAGHLLTPESFKRFDQFLTEYHAARPQVRVAPGEDERLAAIVVAAHPDGALIGVTQTDPGFESVLRRYSPKSCPRLLTIGRGLANRDLLVTVARQIPQAVEAFSADAAIAAAQTLVRSVADRDYLVGGAISILLLRPTTSQRITPSREESIAAA